MANVSWIGKQIARPVVFTLTVVTSNNAGTIILTCGGSQQIAISPSTNTAATTAAEIAAAVNNATGCFKDLSASNTSGSAVVTLTGPADGMPVTLTKTDAGGNATTLTSVAPLSPHDLADGVNYSTGSLPSAGDVLTAEDGSVDILYNLDALAGVILNATNGFIRRSTYTGRIGLPTTNAQQGYPEYRVSELQLNCASFFWEAGDRDSAQQFRLKSVFVGSPVTGTIQGSATRTAAVGKEALEIRGTPAGSALTITGASVAICPLEGQSGMVQTINGLNATVRIGQDASLTGTLTFENCQVQVKASWTTGLTADLGTKIEAAGSAAGPAIQLLRSSYMTWHSTGNPGDSPIVGIGATLDLETSPAALTITGTLLAYLNANILDGAGRGGNLKVQTVGCTLADIKWRTAVGKTYQQS